MRNWSRCRNKVRLDVVKLHRDANVPLGNVTAAHYETFQNQLPPNTRLIIIDALQPKGVLFKGKESADNNICMVLYNNHYYPLKNIGTWFAQTYYCIECESGTNKKNDHICPSKRKCSKCEGDRCLKLAKLFTYCKDCYGCFTNPECADDHKTNGICISAGTCDDCGYWYPSPAKSKHLCGDQHCDVCKKIHKAGYECYITTSPQQHPKSSFRYVFYDFESYQEDPIPGTDKRPHKVNYVVASSYCNNCKKDACTECVTTHHFSGLDGGDPLYDFCYWATSHKINRGATFIAHNAKSYDSHFVLDYLITQGNRPKLIMAGGKIMCMTLPSRGIRFIDSLSFLNMSLSKFSKTFNIPEVKGTFPHAFNKPANYGYNGTTPPLRFYEPDLLKEDSRNQLLQWHGENKDKPFNFAEEIKVYCEADVALLKTGCVLFRSDFLNLTNVDPFRQVTIASTCMEVFRRNYLRANTIGKYIYL